ncbi:MAG: CBS domain-containing protein [Candidatus Methanomethylicia archaeon]
MTSIRSRLLVKDVMTRSIISISPKASITEAARIMSEKDIGGVLVIDENKPVGMLTERDIVRRVVAQGLNPSNTRVEEAMSAPLFFIDANAEISDAARLMATENIRRLPVMDKGKLVGILTTYDILTIAPELFDTLSILKAQPKSRESKSRRNDFMIGWCDSCSEWCDDLREVDGQYLCSECYFEHVGSET